MEAGFELSPEDARRMQEDGAQFVDVREEYEWNAGHVPGSRWITLSELASVATTIEPERPAVFVCRVGQRSFMAAMSFRRAGFLAYNLKGGLEAWMAAGLPLDPPDGHVAAH